MRLVPLGRGEPYVLVRKAESLGTIPKALIAAVLGVESSVARASRISTSAERDDGVTAAVISKSTIANRQ
jgi:hypothetical protein